MRPIGCHYTLRIPASFFLNKTLYCSPICAKIMHFVMGVHSLAASDRAGGASVWVYRMAGVHSSRGDPGMWGFTAGSRCVLELLFARPSRNVYSFDFGSVSAQVPM